MQAIFLVSIITLTSMLQISCQGKGCTQKVEVSPLFINQTGQSQQFLIDFSIRLRSVTHSKLITLTPSSVSQSGNLSEYDYDYEKSPIHHGKIDFDPEDAKCTQVEYDSSLVQLNDPANSSIKLCFGESYIDEPQKIYVVEKSSMCPSGSAQYDITLNLSSD